MSNKDNLLGVIATIFRWKKSIIRNVLIVTIGTAIISWFFLPNYYKSTTIFYVASPDIFKPEQIFGTSSEDMNYFGDDVDVDRILSIAKSNELMGHLIKKFNLYQHYDIDTTNIKAPFKVQEYFMSLYNVEKNKFNAIELSVEDEDPKLAAAIATEARNKTDEIAASLIKKSQSKLISTYESNFIEKEKMLSGVSDTLTLYRQRYGIYDLESQSELLTKLTAEAESNLARNRAKLLELQKSPGVLKDSITMLKANIKGYEEELNNLTSATSKGNINLSRYNLGKDKVEMYSEIHTEQSERLGKDKGRYEQLLAAYAAQTSALHLVEEASLPIEKSRPKRSIIVLSFALISLLLSILAALLFDNYKDVNWKKIINGEAEEA